MATNKHAIIRYYALDQCFRNTGRKFYMEQLIEACNRALSDALGEGKGISRRQVFDDIKFMESETGCKAPIDRIKDGRKTYYRYEDPSFSINNRPLTEAEAEQLRETLLTLNRFQGLPQFEWIAEIIARLESSFNLRTAEATVLLFEQNPYLKGLEHIETIFQAITGKFSLEIIYQGIKHDTPKVYKISPHCLKQYNNRWFLLGTEVGYESTRVTNLPLDRIIDTPQQIQEAYIGGTVDYQEYFEDIIGMTFPKNATVEKIELRVTDSLLPYVKTKPIHGSQKISIREGRNILELNLIINYELKAQILSHGSGLKVLSPLHLKEEIKAELIEMLKEE